jgi:hypothetical protein
VGQRGRAIGISDGSGKDVRHVMLLADREHRMTSC